ncbi:MAG: hypothetical protein FJX47_11735 [Alphaproteobacteria bacterium]|nr:hypothetical protein [Alphaproteobacteria bacterium]
MFAFLVRGMLAAALILSPIGSAWAMVSAFSASKPVAEASGSHHAAPHGDHAEGRDCTTGADIHKASCDSCGFCAACSVVLLSRPLLASVFLPRPVEFNAPDATRRGMGVDPPLRPPHA